MAILKDSITTKEYGGGSTNTLTWSHTCSGSNRLLVVTVPESRVSTVSSITYNSVNLTKAISKKVADPYNPNAEIWYLIAPDTGTHDIVITFGQSITYRVAGAVSFTGCSQSNVLGAVSYKESEVKGKSITITTEYDNSVLIDCLGDTGSTNTPSSGQTAICNFDNRVSSYEVVIGKGDYTQTYSADLVARNMFIVAEFKEHVTTGNSIFLSNNF